MKLWKHIYMQLLITFSVSGMQQLNRRSRLTGEGYPNSPWDVSGLQCGVAYYYPRTWGCFTRCVNKPTSKCNLQQCPLSLMPSLQLTYFSPGLWFLFFFFCQSEIFSYHQSAHPLWHANYSLNNNRCHIAPWVKPWLVPSLIDQCSVRVQVCDVSLLVKTGLWKEEMTLIWYAVIAGLLLWISKRLVHRTRNGSTRSVAFSQ